MALGRRVVRYQPAAGYCGPDSFTYEIADTTDLRATASVEHHGGLRQRPAGPDAGPIR